MKGEFTVINPSDVVLLEGILVFYNADIRDMFDMKLFVDTDADTRLARRGNWESGHYLITSSHNAFKQSNQICTSIKYVTEVKSGFLNFQNLTTVAKKCNLRRKSLSPVKYLQRWHLILFCFLRRRGEMKWIIKCVKLYYWNLGKYLFWYLYFVVFKQFFFVF